MSYRYSPHTHAGHSQFVLHAFCPSTSGALCFSALSAHVRHALTLRSSASSAPLRRPLVFVPTLSCCAFLLFALVFSAAAQAPKGTGKNQQVTRTRATHPLQELLDRAEKAIAEENFAVAVEALEKFIASEPNDAFAHFHLGYALTGLKEWDKAIAAYRRAAELKPDMAAAQLNLGLLLYEHLSPNAAVPALRRAAELLANEARPHYLLGTALERIGNTAEAVREYRAAASLDPRDSDVQLAIGRALLLTENFAQAEAAFRQTLALDQQKPGARLGLVQSLIVQKKYPAAATELDAYLAASPGDTAAWLQLATLRFETEAYDEALAALDRIEASGGATPESLRLRADIYQRQRKFDDAIAVLRRIAEQSPQDAALHARLGRLLLEKRDFPAAEAELIQSLQLDPAPLDPLRDLISVYYLGEKYEAALRMMDRLAVREHPTPFSFFIRATCYDKLMQKVEAIAAYEKFLELDQGQSHDRGIQARARIRTLKRELEQKR